MLTAPFVPWYGQLLQNLLCAEPSPANFGLPLQEESLLPSSSVAWTVFKNPVTLFVGGIAAVILELAHPAVCAGVSQHSSFRQAPLPRLRRTGMAAMTTIYGARSVARPMIERVVQRHEAVRGLTPAGLPYFAQDPELLTWVHATSAFGFVAAYHSYADALRPDDIASFYREGVVISRLYGASLPPTSSDEMLQLLVSSLGSLEPSPALFEFLEVMERTLILPGTLQWIQRPLIRAAVALLPASLRHRLQLNRAYQLGTFDRVLVKSLGTVANRMAVAEHPAVQACRRLGLPDDYLYHNRVRLAVARPKATTLRKSG